MSWPWDRLTGDLAEVVRLLLATPAAKDVRLLLGIGVKGVLIVAAAALVTWFLRSSSAALRHFVWCLAAAALLALPFLELSLPRWPIHLPVLAAPFAEVSPAPVARPVPAPAPVASARPAAVARPPAAPRPAPAPAAPRAARVPKAGATIRAAPVPGAERVRVRSGASASGVAQQGSHGVAMDVASAEQQRAGLAGLLSVWLTGVAVVFAGMLTSVVRVCGLARRARVCTDRRAQERLQRICRELGLARPVVLLEGDADAMPMTFGVRRPAVLLPSCARGWSDARLDAVLRHELAHVQRKDVLTQLVAEAACALHWFNPLAWLVARRLRIERELACDDRVLASGSRASDYATQLVELARALRPVRATALASVTMARPAQLEGRVRALLDEHRSRDEVPAPMVSRLALLAALFVLPLAAAAPAPGQVAPAAAQEPWPTPAPSAAVAPRVAVAQRASSAGGSFVTPTLASAVVAPSAFPGSAPAPWLQAAVCWVAADGSGSINVNRNDDRYFLHLSYDDCDVQVHIRGDVRFTSDFNSIASISEGGSVRFEEDDGRTERRLDIEPGAGGLSYDWSVDRQARPYDAEARAWLEAMLLQFFRATGYAAPERIAWILEEQGMDALREEIRYLRGDYVRRIYYAALLESSELPQEDVAGVLVQAGADIRSNHDLAELLIGTADDYEFTDAVRDAFIAASRNIESDHDRRRVLSAVLERGRLDARAASALIESAGEIRSDHDRAEVLIGLTDRYVLEPAIRPAYLRTASAIRSDHDKRRVLTAVLAEGELSADELAIVLEAASAVRSDHDKAELLIQAAGLQLGAPALQTAYAQTAGTLKSDHDHRRALSALLATELEPDVLGMVLRSARDIGSDHDLSELLIEVLRTQALTPELREEFMRTLQTVGSKHDHGRVSSALLRAAQSGS